MPGWNLKYGDLQDTHVSEDELWSLFNYVFSDSCRKTNTYKFGLIKSICDQIYDLVFNGLGYPLSYEKIFYKFTENYWNLVNRYKLKQMSYNGKSEISKIEIIILTAVDKYKIPETVTFQSLPEVERAKIVATVTRECKKNVIGALYNDFQGKLYSFDLKSDGIILGQPSYDFIAKYKMEIEKLNYYYWARFLEKVNDDDALVRVLEKLELATPQRKDLSIYRDILYLEFQQDCCFYCGKKLNDKIHVDHFIPWTYVKSDNLWNFVLSCPKCNLKKKDNLVGGDYLLKIECRNDEMATSIGRSSKNSLIQEEFIGYTRDFFDRIWRYAKYSGFHEYNGFDFSKRVIR